MIKTLFAAAAITGSFIAVPVSVPGNWPGPESFTSPGITVVYDTKKKAVMISWQQKTSGVKAFIIQRSNDNFGWTDITRIENTAFNSDKIWQYADINPGDGENYYRLQCIPPNGKATYSNSVMVITGSTGKWVMYPVPVGDVLTLQYRGVEKIPGVININIQTIQGKILTRLRCASYKTTIPVNVSNLGRGVYDIRIMIEDEIVWNQRFVK